MTKGIKGIIKKGLGLFNIDSRNLYERIAFWSVVKAGKQQALYDFGNNLKQIVPDISEQYSRKYPNYSDFLEAKSRTVHAFQCTLMLKAVESFTKNKLIMVDIGDSAGTHMLYLKELAKDRFNIETVSVNLDPRAIEKIKARGLKAVLKRAEEINTEDIGGDVDVFTSFEMVEHLHNPTIFLHRIAKMTSCEIMVITVPYLKRSRVGFYRIRNLSKETIYAEDEHIFELCPKDWELLFLHAGWKIDYSKIYYQYPRRWPLVSFFLRWFWKVTDFEGFWGVVLKKDMTYSECYQDWET